MTPGRSNEVALLGAVMRDGSIYEQAREIVQVESFGWHAYGWAWEACESLHEQGIRIDTITVADELERMGKLAEFCMDGDKTFSGRAALSKIRESGEPRSFLSYAENVQDMAAKRKLDTFLTKCVYWAKNGRRAKDIMQDVTKELSEITLYSAQDEYTVPLSTAVSEAYDWTDAASQGKIVGVNTGFKDLDNILGSLYSGNVYLVAGRPGRGKTAFLLSIARHVGKMLKKRVGLFSLEMGRAQVAQRLIAQEGEVDLNRILRGALTPAEWPCYTHAVEQVASWPIIVNDLSSININQIRQTARKIKASGGLDLIAVDYIQLAESGEKNRERRELDVSAVSRGLKYLAREVNVHILAAAQLSRAVEQRADKKAQLSDLRESGSLEQDAYCVMFINETDQSDVRQIEVAKHRNGPTGECSLIYRGPFTRFDNAAIRSFEPRKDIDV